MWLIVWWQFMHTVDTTSWKLIRPPVVGLATLPNGHSPR
jgi:hypothetical protein